MLVDDKTWEITGNCKIYTRHAEDKGECTPEKALIGMTKHSYVHSKKNLQTQRQRVSQMEVSRETQMKRVSHSL